MINPNTIKNIIFFYYTPSFTIDFLLVFFNLVFKVYIGGILKNKVFKVSTSIVLKCINSKFAIVFVR